MPNESFTTKLVAITKGAGELEGSSAQDIISYTARVSNPTNQLNKGTAPKLISYLAKNKHWSPFEMVNMIIEITTSRAIAQQILRHRSFSFQEFSQRYATALSIVKYPARRQDLKNRQNSVDDMDEGIKSWFDETQDMIIRLTQSAYQAALGKGIAKEQARFLLPLATQTKLYMCGNARSWIHYIDLRASNGTQKEHMEIAEGCKKIFTEQFPDIAKALEWDNEKNI